MGKNNLLLGTARGKLGDVVFYRTGGEQRFRTRVRPTNPRTFAQLLQRCVVSTAVKAYGPLVTVCDHAFQNYSGKQKNMERFMRLNIEALRPLALQLVERWQPFELVPRINVGNWSKKDSTDIMLNNIIVSEGDLPNVQVEFADNDLGGLQPFISASFGDVAHVTYQGVCDILGLQAGDQLTFIWQKSKYTEGNQNGILAGTLISRIILMPKDGDMSKQFLSSNTANGNNFYELNDPNENNYGNFYVRQDGETQRMAVYPENTYTMTKYSGICTFVVITSRFENNMWRRSSSRMIMNNNAWMQTLQNALDSYLKSDSSSLYLNQSTSETRNTAVEELKNELKITIAESEETEEVRTKRSKK